MHLSREDEAFYLRPFSQGLYSVTRDWLSPPAISEYDGENEPEPNISREDLRKMARFLVAQFAPQSPIPKLAGGAFVACVNPSNDSDENIYTIGKTRWLDAHYSKRFETNVKQRAAIHSAYRSAASRMKYLRDDLDVKAEKRKKRLNTMNNYTPANYMDEEAVAVSRERAIEAVNRIRYILEPAIDTVLPSPAEGIQAAAPAAVVLSTIIAQQLCSQTASNQSSEGNTGNMRYNNNGEYHTNVGSSDYDKRFTTSDVEDLNLALNLVKNAQQTICSYLGLGQVCDTIEMKPGGSQDANSVHRKHFGGLREKMYK